MILETMNPVLNRPRALAQKNGDVIGAHAGTGEKHTVEPMVIAGFFGPLDLILDGESHDVSIRDIQTTHDGLLSEAIISEITIMRKYI
jgi:hypothetical protein